MRLNTHVKHCFEDYPSLFRNRGEVLNQLYCVIGNCYEWGEDGTIVAECKRPPKAERNTIPEQYVELCHKDFDDSSIVRTEEKTRQFIEQVRSEWDFRKNNSLQYFYPLSENYSLLLTIPDNVRQDYLDGAFEVIDIILSCPVEEVDFNRYSVILKNLRLDSYLETNKKNKEIAKCVLESLEQRFPGRKVK